MKSKLLITVAAIAVLTFPLFIYLSTKGLEATLFLFNQGQTLLDRRTNKV